MAWVQGFAYPARMLLPGRRGDDGADAAPRVAGSGGRSKPPAGAASARSHGSNYQRLIEMARSKGTPLRGNVRLSVVDLRKVMPTDRPLTPEERHRLMLTMGRRGRNPPPMERVP